MNSYQVFVVKTPNANTEAANSASCEVTPEGYVEMNVSILGAGANIPGPPGPPGGGPITFTAGENLSTGRVVVIDLGTAIYFQPSDNTHAGRAYGVTVTSAILGSDVDVQIVGEVTDAAFSFSPDTTLWVGVDGEIFSTVQVGVIQKAGIASANETMKIDFSLQIITI